MISHCHCARQRRVSLWLKRKMRRGNLGVLVMKKNLDFSKGLSLIEAVLAIAIIGAGLVGVMFVFSGGAKSSMIANQTVVASNLAKEKLEHIIADRANLGYAYVITNAASYSDGQLPGNFSVYTRNVTIVEVDPDDDDNVDDFLDPSPGSGYARITIVVSWSGAAESVKLETLIANYVMP